MDAGVASASCQVGASMPWGGRVRSRPMSEIRGELCGGELCCARLGNHRGGTSKTDV